MILKILVSKGFWNGLHYPGKLYVGQKGENRNGAGKLVLDSTIGNKVEPLSGNCALG